MYSSSPIPAESILVPISTSGLNISASTRDTMNVATSSRKMNSETIIREWLTTYDSKS